MKQNIPPAQADEKEADRVIANYGRKPSQDKKLDLMQMLRGQKEQFKENERQREARDKGGRDRSR